MEETYEVKRRRGVEMEGHVLSPSNSHGSDAGDARGRISLELLLSGRTAVLGKKEREK
jgi:hypothetical protein